MKKRINSLLIIGLLFSQSPTYGMDISTNIQSMSGHNNEYSANLKSLIKLPKINSELKKEVQKNFKKFHTIFIKNNSERLGATLITLSSFIGIINLCLYLDNNKISSPHYELLMLLNGVWSLFLIPFIVLKSFLIFNDAALSDKQDLKKAIEDNNLEEIKNLLLRYKLFPIFSCKNNIINYENETINETALMHATKHERKEIIKLFLDAGAKIDSVNYNNETALIYATKLNKPEIVELLLKAKANPLIEDKDGKTFYNHIKNNPEIIAVVKKLRKEISKEINLATDLPPVLANEIAEYLI